MNRRAILLVHITATGIAILTIICFFSFSLVAEIKGDEYLIRDVKRGILYSLPLLGIVMPALVLTGKQLAGRSHHPIIRRKLNRMKFVAGNGILLITLAIYLFYHAHYKTIDGTFMMVQVLELIMGFINLSLIGWNAKDGITLSSASGGYHKGQTIMDKYVPQPPRLHKYSHHKPD